MMNDMSMHGTSMHGSPMLGSPMLSLKKARRCALQIVPMSLMLVLFATCALKAEERLVAVGNLIYAGDKTSVCFSDRFLTTVATEASINTEKRMRAIRMGREDELMSVPFVVMNGNEAFALLPAERELLKRYLSSGGFLLASAGCSSEAWSASFKSELTGIFGADCFQPVPMTHPLFSTLFPVSDPSLSHGGTAEFSGVFVDGRLVCLFSKEGLNDTEHTQGCCCCGGNEIRSAEEIVADALVYALVN